MPSGVSGNAWTLDDAKYNETADMSGQRINSLQVPDF